MAAAVTKGVNPVEEFRIVSLAGRAMVSGMTAGFQNAKDHFLTASRPLLT